MSRMSESVERRYAEAAGRIATMWKRSSHRWQTANVIAVVAVAVSVAPDLSQLGQSLMNG